MIRNLLNRIKNRIYPEDIEIIVMLVLIVTALKIFWPEFKLLWLLFMN